MAGSVALREDHVDLPDGGRLFVASAGEGPPVIMIHGAGAGASGAQHFAANVEAFVAAGHRVIIPDLIGFGRSHKPVDDMGYPLERFTDALIPMLDALDVGPSAIFGNSLGGAIGIDLALRAPERVTHLVLLAPGALESPAVYGQLPAVERMRAIMQDGLSAETMRRMLESFVTDPAIVTDELVEARLAAALGQPPEVMAKLRLPDLTERLPGITQPVLVVWGGADPICPVEGAMKFVRLVKGARVLMLEGIGHWPMRERAELVNDATLRFLSE